MLGIQGVYVWNGIDVIGAIAIINKSTVFNNENLDVSLDVSLYVGPQQYLEGKPFLLQSYNGLTYDPSLSTSVITQGYEYLLTLPEYSGWVPYTVPPATGDI